MNEWRDPETGLTDKERWPDPEQCETCGCPWRIVMMEAWTWGEHICLGPIPAQPSACPPPSVSSRQKQSTEAPSSLETKPLSQQKGFGPQ